MTRFATLAFLAACAPAPKVAIQTPEPRPNHCSLDPVVVDIARYVRDNPDAASEGYSAETGRLLMEQRRFDRQVIRDGEDGTYTKRFQLPGGYDGFGEVTVKLRFHDSRETLGTVDAKDMVSMTVSRDKPHWHQATYFDTGLTNTRCFGDSGRPAFPEYAAYMREIAEQIRRGQQR